MVKFVVDPGKEFQSAIASASEKVDDLTIPLTLIAQSWFKTNRAIFSLKGPGKYKDLSEKYKKIKARKFGSPYPILLASGRLAASITVPGASESINKILNKKNLILGTTTPYAAPLQFGSKFMPARPMVLIGSEQVSPEGVNRRLEAWVKILAKYCVDVTSRKQAGA